MILLYHKVFPEAKTTWWVTPDAFYLQMLDLANKQVVYLDDYDPSNPNHCVITFDGVYENVWKYAVPILQRFGFPFELFVVGDSVGRGNEFDSPEPYASFADLETLQKMVRSGGRLQWHSRTHGSLLSPQPPLVYQSELTVPEDLRRVSPGGLEWFAYPHGRRDAPLKVEAHQRFRGALACDDGDPHDLFDLPRTTVTEQSRFSMTTVSLIIPCYNYGHFAAEAIESALAQTNPPDEILFIDDASSDDSVEVAKRYEPRIRVERNAANLGAVANFNRAVSLTRGDYVCLLGADNRFRSDYVEKTKAVLDAHADVGIAYTHFALFGQKAAIEAWRAGADPHPSVPGIFLRKFPAQPKKPIEEENYIHGSSMYRRNAYLEAGGYLGSGLPEDHFLFARILSAGWKAELVDDFLLEYRQHSTDQLNQLKAMEATNAYLRAQNATLVAQVRSLTEQVHEIENSRTWKVGLAFRGVRIFLVPPRSRRARFARLLVTPLLSLVRASLAIYHQVGFARDTDLIRRSGLFDPAWYLDRYPDVAAARADPAAHYLQWGGCEGRDPSPKFSSRQYLDKYEDVGRAGINPLLHYLTRGRKEGRSIFPV